MSSTNELTAEVDSDWWLPCVGERLVVVGVCITAISAVTTSNDRDDVYAQRALQISKRTGVFPPGYQPCRPVLAQQHRGQLRRSSASAWPITRCKYPTNRPHSKHPTPPDGAPPSIGRPTICSAVATPTGLILRCLANSAFSLRCAKAASGCAMPWRTLSSASWRSSY